MKQLRMLLPVLALWLGAAGMAALAVSYYTLEDAERLQQQGAHAQAARLFRQLAENDNTDAAYDLGQMIRRGEVTTPEPERSACDWFERAADQDHLAAMYELGECYLQGRGRPEEIDTALYLHGTAAELGHAGAQYRLVRLYASGGAVAKNPERAYIYLFMALRGNVDEDPVLRDSLEAELDEQALQRARQFALKLLRRQSQATD
ncbi:TPR repeat protein [Methylohalomonas lacus]|uniref:TPR repeat protein n=1 Tax=Methylohalomonas lacus TaxID=398773 RepID=A0AAE3L0R6_9GAMM|nr:hypothetical protein [Methylohalomonas lacus]MCS3902500.1 TPR repeat protein [Methylohalomonas lacus]